jgi:hypothetical protein
MYFFIFVVITSSFKSNYHTVTTTTVPGYEWNITNSLMFLITTVLCSYIKQPSNDVNIFSSNTHVRSKVYQELYHYHMLTLDKYVLENKLPQDYIMYQGYSYVFNVIFTTIVFISQWSTWRKPATCSKS